MTKQVLIYVRAASSDKEGQALLNVQTAACAAFADAFGYKIERVVSEFGSGTDLARTGLSELFAAVEARRREGEADSAGLPPLSAVLVYDRERLGFSPAHRAIIETMLQKCGVRVLSVSDALAQGDLSRPEGVQAAAESLGFRLAQLLATRSQNCGRSGAAVLGEDVF